MQLSELELRGDLENFSAVIHLKYLPEAADGGWYRLLSSEKISSGVQIWLNRFCSSSSIHASDSRMRGKIVPQIHILKVPRFKAHVWIPVGVDVERCTALQISHSGSERRRQCERRVQDRRDGTCCAGEEVETGVSGRDDGARSQFSDQDTQILDHLGPDSGGRTRSAASK